MHPSTFRAVVFDFDLTLADSSSGIVECITYALQHLHLPLVPELHMRQSIGLSLPATFTYITGLHDAQRAAAFARLFVQRADQVMADMTIMYPGVPAVLSSLQQAGLRLGIVSSKFRYRIQDILRRGNLLQYFDVIIGGEDVTQHKPHPEGLLQAMRHFAHAPEHVVYVGDHPVDAEAASRAGIPFVAVLTGTAEHTHFVPTQPLGIVPDLTALPRLLGA
jgi:phosphoglycolate phosphatase